MAALAQGDPPSLPALLTALSPAVQIRRKDWLESMIHHVVTVRCIPMASADSNKGGLVPGFRGFAAGIKSAVYFTRPWVLQHFHEALNPEPWALTQPRP